VSFVGGPGVAAVLARHGFYGYHSLQHLSDSSIPDHPDIRRHVLVTLKARCEAFMKETGLAVPNF